MTEGMYPPLTSEQRAALREYALANGRFWRQKLREDWMSGKSQGILQNLRNTHGPMWLNSYERKDAPRDMTKKRSRSKPA